MGVIRKRNRKPSGFEEVIRDHCLVDTHPKKVAVASSNSEQLLSLEQAAELLLITPQSLRTRIWRNKSAPPFIKQKKGNRIRIQFKKSALCDWAKDARGVKFTEIDVEAVVIAENQSGDQDLDRINAKARIDSTREIISVYAPTVARSLKKLLEAPVEQSAYEYEIKAKKHLEHSSYQTANINTLLLMEKEFDRGEYRKAIVIDEAHQKTMCEADRRFHKNSTHFCRKEILQREKYQEKRQKQLQHAQLSRVRQMPLCQVERLAIIGIGISGRNSRTSSSRSSRKSSGGGDDSGGDGGDGYLFGVAA